MASSPPRRRFLPEPVETSVRSSKRPSFPNKAHASPESAVHPDTDNMAAVSQPRRFKPQPIEESTWSSRKNKPQHVEYADPEQRSDHPFLNSEDPAEPGFPTAGSLESQPRRFAPEPVETTARSSRRKFAPEPVETTTRSSKDKQPKDQTQKPRRFAPEPVETSTRSRKGHKTDEQDRETTPQPRRRFAPEPISTEKISRRQPSQTADHSSDNSPEQSRSRESSSSSANGSRRFSPELIETAKGTYRQSVVPSPTKSDRTLKPPVEADEEDEESDSNPSPLEESRFSAAALAKRKHEEQRRKSFLVPDLAPIESDSGDDSSAPSLTASRSSAETPQRADSRRAAGDSYTDYVLRLAGQHAAQKDLQAQAMAAYINEVPHEPVAHYGFDDEEEGTIRVGKLSVHDGGDARTFRRSSQEDLNWELKEMQRHHAQLEEAKRQLKHDTAGQSRFSATALATRHKLEAEKEGKKMKKLKAEESEMARMRAAASPPMLGDDLIFPQTISPKMTRCETDQHPRPRSADSDEEDEEIGQQDLWTTTLKVETSTAGGLWGGCCNGNDSRPGTPRNLGLQTPMERDNPFETTTPGRKTPGTRTPKRRIYGTMGFLPLTPPRSGDGDDAFTSGIDKKLRIERQIEDEFPDRVITQVYNYLSLGYPSLAWGFDAELSKISRIPIEELRKDDNNVDAKGYVGAPEGDGVPEEAVTKGGCRRWEALRLYVREWARQSPNFIEDIDGIGRRAEQWGGNVGVRKGSWAH